MNRRRIRPARPGDCARPRGGDARSLGLGLGLGLGLDRSASSSSSRRRGGASADGGTPSFDLSFVFFLLGCGGLVVFGRGGRSGAGERSQGARTTRGSATARGWSPSSPRDRTAGAAGARRSRSARDANERGTSSPSEPCASASAPVARGRATGAVAFWFDIRGSTTRARVASLAVAVEPSGVTSPDANGLVRARVRPDIRATRDRPRGAPAPRAREARREITPRERTTSHRSQRVTPDGTFFLAGGLLADSASSSAHLPPSSRAFPRARRARTFRHQNIGLHSASFVPRARASASTDSSSLRSSRRVPERRSISADSRASAEPRLRRSMSTIRTVGTRARAGRLVTSRRRAHAPPPAPHARRRPWNSSSRAALPPFVLHCVG